MTYEDAIKAVQDGSYDSAPESDLREMLRSCMDIHGPNPTAHHRISQAAEIIRGELQSRYHSGLATWLALQHAIAEIAPVAPADHDVVIQVRDVQVHQADFLAPHSFRFQGIGSSGRKTVLVIHFSQLDARVVYVPKRGPNRVITGFADSRLAATPNGPAPPD